ARRLAMAERKSAGALLGAVGSGGTQKPNEVEGGALEPAGRVIACGAGGEKVRYTFSGTEFRRHVNAGEDESKSQGAKEPRSQVGRGETANSCGTLGILTSRTSIRINPLCH